MDSLLIVFLSLVFIISFIILVKGSDVFIDGAAIIAHKKGVSEHMIGLTLVAFATSIPELGRRDSKDLFQVKREARTATTELRVAIQLLTGQLEV